MNLQRLIEQYISFQRSLGLSFITNAGILRAFGRFCGLRASVASVRVRHVDAFLGKTRPVTKTWFIKLSCLRSFFQYAVSRGHITTAPLPTASPKHPALFVPYIYTREQLHRLFQAIESHPQGNSTLETATVRTMISLYYGAGLRLREATNLIRTDVDLNGSLLTIRNTKFGKTRLVPLGPQLSRALIQYDRSRSKRRPADAPFFTTTLGHRVNARTLQKIFRLLCDRAGIHRRDGVRQQPRIHDLRHAFAVHRLTSWYQQGADVQRLLHHLSVYLGHIALRHTQVYLSMTPELLREASQRFERYAGKERRYA
jgi:integrase/recombinase XerD